jgi:hypothetical protein
MSVIQINYKRAKTYSRTLNLSNRNPVNQERIREKCPLCKGKRIFKSINSLGGHFKEEHIPRQFCDESKEFFEIRKADSFDCKAYLLSLVEKKLKGEI